MGSDLRLGAYRGSFMELWYLQEFLREEAAGLNRMPYETLALADELGTLAKTFIAAEADGRIVGLAAITRGIKESDQHVGSLRVHLRPEVRGAGLGPTLIELALDWADESDVTRVVATPYIPTPEDHGKIEFFRRFGFTLEGIAHKAARLLDGSFTDVALMARVT